MVLTGSESVTSYDPENGNLIWSIKGPTEQYVASVVYGDGLFFMTAGFPTYHNMAIRPDGVGERHEVTSLVHCDNRRCRRSEICLTSNVARTGANQQLLAGKGVGQLHLVGPELKGLASARRRRDKQHY